jgi:hypothetical protein
VVNTLFTMNKKILLLCAATATALAIACVTRAVHAADSTAPTPPSTQKIADEPAPAESKAPTSQSTKNTASGNTTAIASGTNSTAFANGANASSGGNHHDRGMSAPFVGVGGILTISGISEIVLDGNHFMPDTMAHWVAPERAEDCKIELCTKDGRKWTATWIEAKR